MNRSYRDLEVWRESIELVAMIYRLTDPFPTFERFGLTSQIRRSAVSIPANIAEGKGRKSDAAYANHVSIARGSHAELETLLEIALVLGFVTDTNVKDTRSKLTLIGQKLTALHRYLKRTT